MHRLLPFCDTAQTATDGWLSVCNSTRLDISPLQHNFSKMFSTSIEISKSLTFWVSPVGMTCQPIFVTDILILMVLLSSQQWKPSHKKRLFIRLWDVGTVFFTIYPLFCRHEKARYIKNIPSLKVCFKFSKCRLENLIPHSIFFSCAFCAFSQQVFQVRFHWEVLLILYLTKFR